MQLVTWRELLASGLLEGGDHLHAPPGRLPVDVVGLAALGVESSLIAAGDVLDETRNEVFGGVHEVESISVGLVELAGGKLGVVGKVNAFITELAAHFVHTFKTTDNQHLQVQLRSNTHEEVHVELVMVSNEGLGSRTTSNGVHHGSFHLNEIAGVKVVADVANNLRPGNENIARAVVHDQVEITLAETLFLVLQTVVLGGDGVQARRQKDDLSRKDRKLTIGSVLGASPTGESNNTDNVASPEVLVLLLERHVASGVLTLAHNLHLDTLRTNVVEIELGARAALGVDSTGDANSGLGFLLALLKTLVVLEELTQVIGDVELVRIRVGRLGFAELIDSLAADFEVLL